MCIQLCRGHQKCKHVDSIYYFRSRYRLCTCYPEENTFVKQLAILNTKSVGGFGAKSTSRVIVLNSATTTSLRTLIAGKRIRLLRTFLLSTCRSGISLIHISFFFKSYRGFFLNISRKLTKRGSKIAF